MAARPPRPPSARRPPPDPGESSPAADGERGAHVPKVGDAERSRKRSPSPTPRKRATSLSRTGRDPGLDSYGPAGHRLRSESPSSRPGTQQRQDEGSAVRAELFPDRAQNAAPALRRGPEALQELERLSGPAAHVSAGAPSLSPVSAAGLSSRLRLTQQMASKSVGLNDPGSFTAGTLGVLGSQQVGKGMALRIGLVNPGPPVNSSRLRVGAAAGAPKIAPSTLVASRLLGELKEHGGPGARAAPAPAAHPGRKGPRTALWASEIRAASMRFGRDAQEETEPPHTAAASTGPKPHLPADKDPWVALERLRLNPESAEFVYMLSYRRNDGMCLGFGSSASIRRVRLSSVEGFRVQCLEVSGQGRGFRL